MRDRIAFVDLGSNAARFLLAEIASDSHVRILREERVQPRLGEGPPGALSRAAIDTTVSAVHRFLASVRKMVIAHAFSPSPPPPSGTPKTVNDCWVPSGARRVCT